MKVKISFTVDIDPESWMLDYGVAKDEVRDDVRAYVENGAIDHLREQGHLVGEPEFKTEAYRA